MLRISELKKKKTVHHRKGKGKSNTYLSNIKMFAWGDNDIHNESMQYEDIQC